MKPRFVLVLLLTMVAVLMMPRQSRAVIGVGSCGWCGNKCEPTAMGKMCLDVAPPQGMACLSQNGVCTAIPTQQISPVPSTTTCKTSWWYDDKTPYCTLSSFCGETVPSGVKMFDNYSECRSSLGVTDAITATASCGGVSMTGVRSVNVQSNILGAGNVWEMVTDMKTGETILTSYLAGWSVNSVSYVDPNLKFTGIRMGNGLVGSLPIYSDGRTYMITAFYAPYTTGVPVIIQTLASTSFSFNCPGTSLTPAPTCIERPRCLDATPPCKIPEMSYYCPRTGILGDANGDKMVDLVDFAIWKNQYLNFVQLPLSSFDPAVVWTADFNKDGIVDLVDFSIWKVEYLKK